MDHTFDHAHLCIYDNNFIATVAYEEVLMKEKTNIGL